MDGLTYVEFVKLGEGKFRLKEHYGKLGLCSFYKDAFGTPQEVVNESEVTAMTYSEAEKCFNVTPTSVESITLKDPATLYEQGVFGIEQWTGETVSSEEA